MKKTIFVAAALAATALAMSGCSSKSSDAETSKAEEAAQAQAADDASADAAEDGALADMTEALEEPAAAEPFADFTKEDSYEDIMTRYMDQVTERDEHEITISPVEVLDGVSGKYVLLMREGVMYQCRFLPQADETLSAEEQAKALTADNEALFNFLDEKYGVNNTAVYYVVEPTEVTVGEAPFQLDNYDFYTISKFVNFRGEVILMKTHAGHSNVVQGYEEVLPETELILFMYDEYMDYMADYQIVSEESNGMQALLSAVTDETEETGEETEAELSAETEAELSAETQAEPASEAQDEDSSETAAADQEGVDDAAVAAAGAAAVAAGAALSDTEAEEAAAPETDAQAADTEAFDVSAAAADTEADAAAAEEEVAAPATEEEAAAPATEEEAAAAPTTEAEVTAPATEKEAAAPATEEEAAAPATEAEIAAPATEAEISAPATEAVTAPETEAESAQSAETESETMLHISSLIGTEKEDAQTETDSILTLPLTEMNTTRRDGRGKSIRYPFIMIT